MASKSGKRAAAGAAWHAVRSATRSGGPGIGALFAAIPRMIGARLRGEYKGLGMGRMSGMALAAAYIVSPIDAVPEAFLLVFGLADDALVAAWLVGALLAETGAFLEWEGAGRPGSLRPPAGGTVIDGEVSGSERAHQG